MLKYLAAHPTAANLIMLMLMALGITALPNIKRETFPDSRPVKVETRVIWPGASPVDVEESICQRLEEAVAGVAYLKEKQCEAIEGLGRLIVEMDDKGDENRFINDIKTEVDAIDDFPDQAEQPIVSQFNRFDDVVSIAVTAETYQTHLKSYAEDLKHRLQRLNGVADVEMQGFSERQLRVELSVPLVRQYNLSLTDISTAVERQNVKMPLGQIETDDKTLLIRYDEQRTTAEELMSLVIASNAEGAEIRLGDIATVVDQFELDEEKIYFDGKPATILKISKSKADDSLTVLEDLKTFLAKEEQTKPFGVSLTLTQDKTSIVVDRLNMLVDNGWQGFVLVALTLALFFRLRFAFWVAMGLPVSFLATLYVMSLFGISINMITMVALLMAIGILMDDAIVIAESIAAYVYKKRQGISSQGNSEAAESKQTLSKADNHAAVVDGAMEGLGKVSMGVLSSFLTTVSVFIGLAFIEGEIGKVLKFIPIVLLVTLAVSLIEAFLVLPGHLVHSLEKNPSEDKEFKFKKDFNAAFERFRETTLIKAVEFLVQWRYFFVGGVIGLLFITFALPAGGLLRFSPFPELDGDLIEARILMPQGTPLSHTEEVVDWIVKQSEAINREKTPEQPAQQPLIQHTTIQYNYNPDSFEQGAHIATVKLDLLSAEIRTSNINELTSLWREKVGEVPGVIALQFKQPTLGPAGRAIEIRLQHDDLEVLSKASWQLQNYLDQFEGANDLMDDLRPGKEEINVRIRPGASSYGVDSFTIASQLRSAFQGSTADEVQVGYETLEVDVRLSKIDRSLLSRFDNFPIVMADGSQIPLANVAEITYERNFARVNRYDGLRTVTVLGDVNAHVTNAAAIINQAKEEYFDQLEADYPGLQVVLDGQAANSQETAQSMVRAFILGLFSVYVILSFQFKSYTEPVIVMLAIPLALIGVFWSHLIMGYDLTMPSMVGFISLAGIVVNNSILLVQYVKWHVEEGYDVHQAAVLASKERFRAVFLTSATTMAGLLPLMFETSLQAQILIPLVLSIVGGIFATTLLVLFVIPCLYCIMDDMGLIASGTKRIENDGSQTV
ncbi:efflux RND transporter permease subunit [Litoribacillus peritrichatus]|uniref:Efflux RND transporter permease subunit n=1 Tax=Litoribacillus peritrichatus TaxID=718191 RepID=A0ABP7MQA9_9GAMM